MANNIFDHPGTIVTAGRNDLWKTKLLSNPIDQYSGKDISAAINFVKLHSKESHIIAGILSYDLAIYRLNLKPGGRLKNKPISIFAYDKSDKLPTVAAPKIEFAKPSYPDKDLFIKSVKDIKRQIEEGSIYQINLSTEIRAKLNYPNHEIFSSIKENFPDTNLFYSNLGDEQVFSASPETFLQISSNGKITTRPVKGTAKRMDGKAEDLAAKEQLKRSEKERSELNMITDLLRNDLSGVCETGSVTVELERNITKHRKVWHASSTITGRKKDDLTAFEALLGCFPGGSITGCPKIRAIELIDKFELSPRGIYTGVAFEILPDGSLNSSILIRTLTKRGSNVSLRIGSGIVYDSEPEKEWAETLSKAYLISSFSVSDTLN